MEKLGVDSFFWFQDWIYADAFTSTRIRSGVKRSNGAHPLLQVTSHIDGGSDDVFC